MVGQIEAVDLSKKPISVYLQKKTHTHGNEKGRTRIESPMDSNTRTPARKQIALSCTYTSNTLLRSTPIHPYAYASITVMTPSLLTQKRHNRIRVSRKHQQPPVCRVDQLLHMKKEKSITLTETHGHRRGDREEFISWDSNLPPILAPYWQNGLDSKLLCNKQPLLHLADQV